MYLTVMKILNFMGGEFRAPLKGEFLENFNPSTGKQLSLVADSTGEDIELAVQSAKAAFPTWSRLKAQERAAWLLKLADKIRDHAQELAEIESEDQGKPVWLAREMDISRVEANFRYFAGAILHAQNESTQMDDHALNYTLRTPVGVCGLISPWNLPLYLLSWKMAPALACGNTVVCKPSEFTSHTAAKLCEYIQEIGFPKGVINMVFGRGPTAGDALVRHPEVPIISFTGGTATGQKIIEASAPHFKKVSLELGGKNPNVIFADCDFEQTVKTTLRSSFLNQGEICLCGSRIYVEESLYDKFLQEFVAQTEKLQMGDPKSDQTFMGALVSKPQYEKVMSYIELSKSEGGKIRAGGVRPKMPTPFSDGYFIRPTIITDLPESSRCVQEEIFGPVVTISKFKNIDDAIEKANGVRYGLSASVWTQDISKAHRMARELQVGTIWVNTWLLRDLRVPFGGTKASGIGREGAEHSLDFFSDIKNVCVRI